MAQRDGSDIGDNRAGTWAADAARNTLPVGIQATRHAPPRTVPNYRRKKMITRATLGIIFNAPIRDDDRGANSRGLRFNPNARLDMNQINDERGHNYRKFYGWDLFSLIDWGIGRRKSAPRRVEVGRYEALPEYKPIKKNRDEDYRWWDVD